MSETPNRESEALRRAAAAIRAELPEPPAGMDGRVLGAVEHERRGGARRHRGLRSRRRRGHTRLVPAVAALAALLALSLVARPLGGGEAGVAVAIAPLRADCRAAADGDGRLVVAATWSGAEARRFATVLARFERRTGIDTSYEYETRDIAAKLETRIKRGCPPDVALLPQPGTLSDLARRHHIQPIEEVAGDLVRRWYGPSWRRLGTVDGRLYGVWFKAANKSIVWYSPPALRAARVDELPASWAELLAAARRLRAAGIRPLAVAGAAPWTLTDWFENVYLRSAGPRRYRQLAEHRIPWTHPSVVRALRILSELLGDESLAGAPAEALDTSFEEAVEQLVAKPPRAAMFLEGDFVRGFVPAGRRAAVDFFPFPAVDARAGRATVVGGDVAAMFTRSAAARRLIRFLATPEAAQPWLADGGFLSPNRGVDPRSYPDPLTRRAAEDLVGAPAVAFDLSDLQPPAFGSTAEQGMWEIFQDYLRSPQAAAGMARRLESAADAAESCERAIRGRC